MSWKDRADDLRRRQAEEKQLQQQGVVAEIAKGQARSKEFLQSLNVEKHLVQLNNEVWKGLGTVQWNSIGSNNLSLARQFIEKEVHNEYSSRAYGGVSTFSDSFVASNLNGLSEIGLSCSWPVYVQGGSSREHVGYGDYDTKEWSAYVGQNGLVISFTALPKNNGQFAIVGFLPVISNKTPRIFLSPSEDEIVGSITHAMVNRTINPCPLIQNEAERMKNLGFSVDSENEDLQLREQVVTKLDDLIRKISS